MQKRILIIDDDINALKSLVSMVSSLGYEALTAQRGAKGLKMIREEKPDLILLDITMPLVDGFKVLVSIQDIIKNGQCTVVMVTVSYKKEDIVRTISLGAKDYIVKPVTPKKLKARIEKIFNEKDEGKEGGRDAKSMDSGEATQASSVIPDKVSSKGDKRIGGILIRYNLQSEILLVKIRGSAECLRENSPDLEYYLKEVFAGHKKIVVDIRGIGDIDIMNVDYLGRSFSSLQKGEDITLKLVSDKEQERILRKGGLLRHLSVHRSPEDAFGWF